MIQNDGQVPSEQEMFADTSPHLSQPDSDIRTTVCKEEMMHFLYGLLRNADQEILTGWVMEELAEKKDAILEVIIDIVSDSDCN